jgi:hypothetical protein
MDVSQTIRISPVMVPSALAHWNCFVDQRDPDIWRVSEPTSWWIRAPLTVEEGIDTADYRFSKVPINV